MLLRSLLNTFRWESFAISGEKLFHGSYQKCVNTNETSVKNNKVSKLTMECIIASPLDKCQLRMVTNQQKTEN
jgi:hypothetical protein